MLRIAQQAYMLSHPVTPCSAYYKSFEVFSANFTGMN